MQEVTDKFLWPKVDGDELYSSRFMHMQLNFSNDYAESLMPTVTKIWNLAHAEKMDHFSLCADICYLCHQCSHKEV